MSIQAVSPVSNSGVASWASNATLSPITVRSSSFHRVVSVFSLPGRL